jgi:hypothetical protein
MVYVSVWHILRDGLEAVLRIRMRTQTCSSFKQTEHSRGGLSLQTLSSEERLRCAPFLTVLGTHCVSRSFPLPPQCIAGPASHAHPVASKRPRNQTPHAYAAFCVGVPAVAQCPPPSHAGRGEYSGSVLLSDVPPPLRKAQTPASAGGRWRMGDRRDAGRKLWGDRRAARETQAAQLAGLRRARAQRIAEETDRTPAADQRSRAQPPTRTAPAPRAPVIHPGAEPYLETKAQSEHRRGRTLSFLKTKNIPKAIWEINNALRVGFGCVRCVCKSILAQTPERALFISLFLSLTRTASQSR